MKRALKILLAGLLLAICAGSRHPDRMPTWDLLLNVSFDRGDASDVSPLATTAGTLNGNAAVSGRVVVLDGTGDYVSYADTAKLDLPSAFTVSCWFEPSTPGSVSRSICGKYNSTGNQRSYYIVAGYGVGYWDVVISATGGTLSGTTALNYRFSHTIPSSGWHHLACTVDTNAASGDRIRLWVDGAEVAETIVQNHSAFTPYNNSLALEVGTIAGGTNGWKGNLDDFRIYRRALSAAEVGSIYASGRL